MQLSGINRMLQLSFLIPLLLIHHRSSGSGSTLVKKVVVFWGFQLISMVLLDASIESLTGKM